MRRIGFIALSLCLFTLTACAVSESPRGGKGGGAEEDPSNPDNPVVIMETSMGTVKMELFEKRAPISVANFLKYVETRHYDGTIFHRVIKGFMVQGGGFTPGMRKEKATFEPIKNEAGNGLRNKRGTLAMARTGEPNSATSQFFVNVVDNGFLDRAEAKDNVGYAVFGRVTDGMDVIDQIRGVPTGANDIPLEDVLIKSIRLVNAK